MRLARWSCFLFVLLFSVPAGARDRLPPSLREAGIDERLGESVPLSAVFRDEEGQAVRLGNYFHRGPVILVFAYFECPMLCTRVLNGLVDSLRGLAWNAGDQFQVVVVSFDARETPALARLKKQRYVNSYGRSATASGWHFLTGDTASIEQVTQAAGFHFAYDREHDQFAHASGILILTPEGTVARYFLGIDYDGAALLGSLKDAAENRIARPAQAVPNQGAAPPQPVMLFCFQYDPVTGKYTVVVMNVLRLAGLLAVLAVVFGLAWMWRRDRRKASRDLGTVR